ncbi:MAG: 50S ribosome-binding GTPase [Planctomycetia bacterium]|nr:50S ribosome-binding GTPase [Planctomycetia bacterium]
MAGFFERLFSPQPKKRVPLVVALNKIDRFPPGDWDHLINCPSEEQTKNIDARCQEVARRIARTTGIPRDQIVYYSALQYYRTETLVSALISATELGFKFGDFNYFDFTDKITDPRALKVVEKNDERRKYRGKKPIGELFLEVLKQKVSQEDYERFKEQYDTMMSVPPKVMLLGQTGVGKTQTVCALLGLENLGVSHLDVGTLKMEEHRLESSGGKIDLIDLPGYGVNEQEDAKYYEMYKDALAKSDVVLLIIEATNRSFAQDEKMIQQLLNWMGSEEV